MFEGRKLALLDSSVAEATVDTLSWKTFLITACSNAMGNGIQLVILSFNRLEITMPQRSHAIF